MHEARAEAERWLAAAREDLVDAARELDLLYVPTRYPNGLDTGTPAQAFSEAQSKRALDLAARFVAAAAAGLG